MKSNVLSTEKLFWILLKTNEDIKLLESKILSKNFKTNYQIWKSPWFLTGNKNKTFILFVIVKENNKV